ncbi:MAG: tetratricopeptide repeat protein [Alphaproteobacteria bacterium]|nr:tetratricopeptide repeat protein [Alphaproteobacteria bacterium]
MRYSTGMQGVHPMQQAARLMQQGKFREAEPIIRQALAQRPGDAQIMHMLAAALFETERQTEAIELMQRALKAQPQAAPLHGHLGEMYRRTGNLAKAIEHGERAAALQPGAVQAHNNLAVAYSQAGQLDKALAACDRAIAIQSNHVGAIANRGNVLRQQGRLSDAEVAYRRALAINPNHPETLNNLGTVLRDQGKPTEAIEFYRRAVAQRRGYVDAGSNLALALKDVKEYEEATQILQAILRAHPRDASAASRLGAVALDQGQPDKAIIALEQSIAVNPNDGEAQNMLGQAYQETGQPHKAEAALRRSIALKPDYADPWNNLGNVLKELGRMSEALAAFEKAISIRPDMFAAYVNLAEVKTYESDDDPHLKTLERYLTEAQTLAPMRQVNLHFATGKAYNDLKRYDDAFAQFAQANVLKRATISYDEAAMMSFFRRIGEVFDAGLIRRLSGSGDPSAQPIFVLGMPRSGTTLIEQIIASHPKVRPGGELRDFSRTVADHFAPKGTLPFAEYMNGVAPDEMKVLGREYVRRLGAHSPGAAHITDKMPQNFFSVGLIHLALPNAKIVHAMRSPVDTCVSCFTKLFAGQQDATYDLAELGRYYRAYHELMGHWRSVLPAGSFLDVRYEDVVGDIEGQSRRLLEFCGLAWDAKVLDFHKTDRPVKTASAAQVRQPLYSSAVARWRHYEKHLGPLLKELGDLAEV